jgi:hypothetical protein
MKLKQHAGVELLLLLLLLVALPLLMSLLASTAVWNKSQIPCAMLAAHNADHKCIRCPANANIL